MLYSWRFSRYNAPIHWHVHGHMTSNNETVSRQTPWAGNIAKIMTSTGKQFTVTREMLTAVALFVFHRSDPFLLYNKSLNAWSLGEQWILFVSGNIEILGKQISLFPSGPVIKCLMINDIYNGWAKQLLTGSIARKAGTVRNCCADDSCTMINFVDGRPWGGLHRI